MKHIKLTNVRLSLEYVFIVRTAFGVSSGVFRWHWVWNKATGMLVGDLIFFKWVWGVYVGLRLKCACGVRAWNVFVGLRLEYDCGTALGLLW